MPRDQRRVTGDAVPRLQDIRSHALEARSFTAGLTLQEFLASAILQHAVVRCLTVVGEAASHVPAGARAELARVPWDAIAGFRDVEYRSVDYDKVWVIVQEDLPQLIEVIETLLETAER